MTCKEPYTLLARALKPSRERGRERAYRYVELNCYLVSGGQFDLVAAVAGRRAVAFATAAGAVPHHEFKAERHLVCHTRVEITVTLWATPDLVAVTRKTRGKENRCVRRGRRLRRSGSGTLRGRPCGNWARRFGRHLDKTKKKDNIL